MSITWETTTRPRQRFLIDRLGYLFCGACLDRGRGRGREALVEDVTRADSTGRLEVDEVCDGCQTPRASWPVEDVEFRGPVEHVAAKIF